MAYIFTNYFCVIVIVIKKVPETRKAELPMFWWLEIADIQLLQIIIEHTLYVMDLHINGNILSNGLLIRYANVLKDVIYIAKENNGFLYSK